MKHFYFLLLLPTCALCLSLCKTTATPSASPTSKSSAEPIATASATSATTESASSAATASAISAEADAISSPEPEAAKVEKDTLLMCKTPKSMPSQILRRIAYITSYNHDTKCPNWVAWHLKKENLNGPYKRNGVPYYDDEGRALGIGQVTELIAAATSSTWLRRNRDSNSPTGPTTNTRCRTDTSVRRLTTNGARRR